MKIDLLRKHIKEYLFKLKEDPNKFVHELEERGERSEYYKSWTAEKLRSMSKEDLGAYLSKLWAMRIWGNKQYVVDQIVDDNGLPTLLSHLSELLWSKDPIESRWRWAGHDE